MCVSICALIGYIVKISISYSKLKSEQRNISSDIDLLKSCSEANTSKLSILSNKFATIDILVSENSKKFEKSEKKFDELFASRNKTNEVLAELNTTIRLLVSNIDKQFENLDTKIEDLKRGK